MAFVLNFFKTVRNHWKKSIVFTGIGLYGIKFGKGKYEDDLLRREYCAEAKVYGEQSLDLGARSRKITVFLNPAASGGQAKKLFEKNAAPVLYLAGLEVNVVKTEYDGQVKEFMKFLEKKHVDGIVVAGGNGTLVETVTGIMRKEDKGFRQKIPMGVIPVGETNRFARFFYGSEKTDVRRMLDAAMAVVRGVSQKLDVIKVQGEDGKSTYALCGLEAGGYRDAKERTSKYWYFGPLKHRFTYLRRTLGSWPPSIQGSVEYVLAKEDDGTKKVMQKVEEKPKQAWTWSSIIFGSRKNVKGKPQEELEEEEEEVDPDEADYVKTDLNTVELTLTPKSTSPEQQQKLSGIEVEMGPADLAKGDFINEGWRRIQEPEWKMGNDSNERLLVSKFKFTPQIIEDSTMWYTIDGEHFEAMPIEVSLLRNRLRIFCNPSENLQGR